VLIVQAAVIGLVQDAALLDTLLDLAQVPIAVVRRVPDPAALDAQLAEQGSMVAVSSTAGASGVTSAATGATTAATESSSSGGSTVDVANAVPVSDDIIAVRDAVSEALWSVAGNSPPSHFSVLSDTRLAIDRHLTEVARSGVWLRTYAPLDTVPALVLAHSLYGDALRSTEIVSRNRIRHPGFVPATELQIAKS
jgi:hypothetical protein